MFNNSSILVTGGTGSFGNTFVPMILAKYNPRRVIVYSRDEMKQWEMAQKFQGDPRVRFFIGDVRDKDRLYRALDGVDYVVHAAATKIVPTAEYNPFECVKTNINGAMNLIDACIDKGVKRVVALSTDKASSPINLYGATKLASDKLFVAGNSYSGGHGTRFAVVRYGNVMGSRGSVIPFFMSIRDKGVLPITDERMTCFMISQQEGVELVWHAFEDMVGGEIYVKKMPSMKVINLARVVAPEARQEIIGLRPGEKLHEQMISAEDSSYTYDYADYFKILPAINGWASSPERIKDGKKVPEGFVYSSDNNCQWMSDGQLRDWIEANLDKIGTISPVIPYGRQDITKADIDAVLAVLHSDFLTQGPQVPRFEQCVARHVGAAHAVAVNSATSALHIACLALGLGPGDRLWTTPVTFVASANCGLYCGAEVDFVDIDPRTYNLCAHALAQKLEQAERDGRLPKVVVAVHLCGQPCDMQAIHALAQRYGFKVIEDASHAIGGKYRGEFIGNGRYSDISVFSFHPVKIVTTAEGGMALTNDAELAGRMALLRSHGITRDPAQMTHEADGPWYYQQIDLGFNYRMTELQAVLGVSQMQRLDDYVARRHELATRYDALLADLPVTTPWQHPDSYSGLHLYVIRLHLEKIGKTRREVFEFLRESGIGVNLHYIPVHTQPYYRRMGFQAGDFPQAQRYYAEAISLPMFQTMTHEQQDDVVRALRQVLAS